MSSNGVNANIPQGIEYRATDDADDISWSNRKVADGRCGVVCCAAMLLIWLSVCLWVTDLSLSGSLAQPLGIGLLLFVWGAMAVPVHYLMKTLGRESIRVTDSGIEFRFAGLGWPRRVVAAREEMAGMSLIDRRELGSIARLGILVNTGCPWTRRPTRLLIAERMGHEQKTKLHALLCSVIARRGWPTPAPSDADREALVNTT